MPNSEQPLMHLNLAINVTDKGGSTPGMPQMVSGLFRRRLLGDSAFVAAYGNSVRELIARLVATGADRLGVLGEDYGVDELYVARTNILDALDIAGLMDEALVSSELVTETVSTIVGDSDPEILSRILVAAVDATYVFVLGASDGGSGLTQHDFNVLMAPIQAAGIA